MTKKKILIIDDMEDVCRVVKTLLDSCGRYETFYETSGVAGLARARKLQPQLILLDVTMPDMAGSDVAQKLKDEPLTSSIPIVFLTGVVRREESCMSQGLIGGYPFLAKPVDGEEILRCVAMWVA